LKGEEFEEEQTRFDANWSLNVNMRETFRGLKQYSVVHLRILQKKREEIWRRGRSKIDAFGRYAC